MDRRHEVAPAEGKLGVLVVGLGAVGTTLIAGVHLVRKGVSKPIGSVTQMGTIRLGKRTDNRSPFIKDFVPLAKLDDLVFGGWDIFEDTAYEAAKHAAVLSNEHIEAVREELQALHPMKAVFDQNYVRRLHGPNVKTGATKYDLAMQLIEDMKTFKKDNGCARLVMLWCASTETFIRVGDIHRDLATFEAAMKANHEDVAPSMIYCYAALKSGVPFVNGAPNLSADVPCLYQYAAEHKIPV